MLDFIFSLLILAQEEAPAPAQQAEFFEILMAMAPWMVFAMIAYYLIIILPENKNRQKQGEFYSSLKKNDQIVTVSGIYGTIASVSPDQDEAVIKIDDNTRMKIRKSSIQGKIDPKKSESKGTDAKS